MSSAAELAPSHPPLTADDYEQQRAHEEQERFRRNGANGSPIIGRVLPHSLDDEEMLIASMWLDPADVIPRCREARITPDSFFDTRTHRPLVALTYELFDAHKEVAIDTVASELMSRGLLDQVGGHPALITVSRRVPTTAMAGHFIEKVREQAHLRSLIRAASGIVEDCYNFTGGIDDFASEQRAKLEQIAQAQPKANAAFDWDQMLAFDPKADADCLMGRRFLGRTGAAVIVAPSGVGKSVMALQLCACAALGQPFFGMKMSHPMRVLYIQAEDDFGDVSESAQGFVRGIGATPDQLAQLKQRLRIERWNDAAGQRFIDRLASAHRRWPFDLVAINPLFSFCGCNVSEQSELSPFLRNGLNPILNQTRAAAIVVHHTNKPPADPKANDKALESELRYSGSGSSELTNWARAYITLQSVRAAGEHVHKMVFAKRGTRTGIVDQDGHATTSVYIEHAKTGLCWLPSEYAPSADGKFVQRFDLAAALNVFEPGLSWADNESAIARAMEVSPRTVRRHKQAIIEHA